MSRPKMGVGTDVQLYRNIPKKVREYFHLDPIDLEERKFFTIEEMENKFIRIRTSVYGTLLWYPKSYFKIVK